MCHSPTAIARTLNKWSSLSIGRPETWPVPGGLKPLWPGMDSKVMFIKPRALRHSGFALSEMLVVMGISTIAMLAITAFTMFSSRSFAAIFNYVDLDDANRVAMDKLSRDIRQANGVT